MRKPKEINKLVIFFLVNLLALSVSTSAIAGQWCDWMNDTKILLDEEETAISSEKAIMDELGTVSLAIANDPDIQAAVDSGVIPAPLVRKNDIRVLNRLRVKYNKQVRDFRDLSSDWDELTVLVCDAEA